MNAVVSYPGLVSLCRCQYNLVIVRHNRIAISATALFHLWLSVDAMTIPLLTSTRVFGPARDQLFEGADRSLAFHQSQLSGEKNDIFSKLAILTKENL